MLAATRKRKLPKLEKFISTKKTSFKIYIQKRILSRGENKKNEKRRIATTTSAKRMVEKNKMKTKTDDTKHFEHGN